MEQQHADMKCSTRKDHMAKKAEQPNKNSIAIWISIGSLLVATIALTFSVLRYTAQEEMSLAVEKNRVFQTVWSARLLLDRVTGLADVIAKLEDQLGIDATIDQTLTPTKKSLAALGLPDFLATPHALWMFTDKLLQKAEDDLDDPKKEESPANYHEFSGILETYVKVMQTLSDRLTAKRERLKKQAKENTGEPTSGG